MNNLIKKTGLTKISISIVVMTCLLSCASNKKIAYFQDIKSIDRAQLENTAAFVEPTIQVDDILSVNVFTLDPTSGAVINQAAPTGVVNSVASAAQTGYLVDKNGDIELVVIGKINVVNLTTFEAKELIRKKVSEIFKNPSIEVRFANFKVSVFGEVNAPSTYTIPNEKVTILDALSRAGDLTIYGKRENILVVRDNNGKKEFARLNLNSSDVFNSPFYYLKQNDLVYVEPNKAKVSTNNAAQIQTITVISSIVSILVVAISLFR